MNAHEAAIRQPRSSGTPQVRSFGAARPRPRRLPQRAGRSSTRMHNGSGLQNDISSKFIARRMTAPPEFLRRQTGSSQRRPSTPTETLSQSKLQRHDYAVSISIATAWETDSGTRNRHSIQETASSTLSAVKIFEKIAFSSGPKCPPIGPKRRVAGLLPVPGRTPRP